VIFLSQAVLLVLVLPAAVGWAGGKLAGRKGMLVSILILVAAAAMPVAWMVYATRDADGITRAAAGPGGAILFLFSLSAVGLGFAQATRKG
jgi:hypothetical protein